MIWLTWRQQRTESVIAAAALAMVAFALIFTGRDMASGYQSLGLAACLAHDPSPNSCQSVTTTFMTQFSSGADLIGWLNLLPLVLGVLLAAPFVLELEQGTYRLAWTQSVTRQRWTVIRLGLIVGVAVAVSIGLTLLTAWWSAPLDQIGSRLNSNQFEFEGVVPIAYTVFAAAVCLASGTMFRRSTPGIGITLVVYVVTRRGLEKFRYSYLAPVTKHLPILLYRLSTPAPPSRADYVMSTSVKLPEAIMRLCNGGSLKVPFAGSAKYHLVAACLGRHGAFASVTYQPASRFWLFQGIESALFLVPTVGLLALTAWWVKNRIV
jgi:hypothetical protein